jgi:hypothetical protein
VDTTGKRRRRWSAELKQRIAEESFEGNTSVAIRPWFATYLTLRKSSRRFAMNNQRLKRLTPEEVRRAIVAINDGVPYAAVAKRFHVSDENPALSDTQAIAQTKQTRRNREAEVVGLNGGDAFMARAILYPDGR